jgi:ubiquinone/menaquinone biosynthesis C-methylase UbiE
MKIQEQIKEELLKELYSNVDNIYDFMQSRYELDKHCNDAMIKKLNELKDIIYKVSQFCELS